MRKKAFSFAQNLKSGLEFMLKKVCSYTLCRFLFAISIIAHSYLFSADEQDPDLSLDQNITFVSLGSHCEVAAHLNVNQLRKAAFPFDWLLSCNHDPFLMVLENDFAFFLDEQLLIQHPTLPSVIENCRYEIEFRHDWPFPDLWSDSARYQQQLQEMNSKYDRRINRFRELRHYPGKVFFVRAAFDLEKDTNLYRGTKNIGQITTEQARRLKNTLDHYFPDLDFTLVIINYLENNAEPIEAIDNVLECRISKHQKHIDYTNAFNSLVSLVRK